MMKTALIALALAAPGLALAQAPAADAPKAPAIEVPKANCEPKPEYPGRLGMQIQSRRTEFQKDMKNYETCIKAYVETRKATIRANEVAVNAAVDEYNTLMTKIRKDQEDASNR